MFWLSYNYDELIAHDNVNLDTFWLRDESLEDSADLPKLDVLEDEMIEELQAALEQLMLISADLGEPTL